MKKIETVVILYYPGIFWAEEKHVKVSSIKEGLEVAKRDEKCFGCTFKKAPVIIDERGAHFYGEPVFHKKTYIFGQKVDRQEVEELQKQDPAKYTIMLNQMGRCKYVVKTRLGDYQPYCSGETVVMEG